MNGAPGRPVDFVERGEEPSLVELARRQRQREVVPGAEMARRPVAQAGLLAHPLGHLGADLLRRFPGLAPFALVVAGAQDLGDRVVVDLDAVDPAAERVERRVDLGVELDLLGPQVGRDLLGEGAVVEHLELTAFERITVRVRLRRARPARREPRRRRRRRRAHRAAQRR